MAGPINDFSPEREIPRSGENTPVSVLSFHLGRRLTHSGEIALESTPNFRPG